MSRKPLRRLLDILLFAACVLLGPVWIVLIGLPLFVLTGRSPFAPYELSDRIIERHST